MENRDHVKDQEGMRLRVAFAHWITLLIIFIALSVAASTYSSSTLTNLAFLCYFGAGIYLNRSVLRKIIEWHPMYNTIENVSSAKVKYFLFWPIAYLFLFIRLGINKVI